MQKSDYLTNGISLTPTVPTVGDKVKVVYDGLLSRSGAKEVYAHVGFGPSWSSSFDYQMTKTNAGFETTIPISNVDSLNLCFRDSANNWDNNSGQNYSFRVEE